MRVKIAIIGPGKMGRAVRDLARVEGHEIVAELDIGQVAQDALKGTDVAIEFTQPDAAAENLVQLAGWKIPTVCGTTGWYGQLADVRAAVKKAGTALVYAPNFSIGVQLFLQIARAAATALSSRPEFAARIVDLHHVTKKDAPSGTAIALRDALLSQDATREYPIASVREGEVPGTHELHIEGPGENILLQHAAKDRTIFARGALVAARWLVERPRRGVFTFDQVLFGEGHETA